MIGEEFEELSRRLDRSQIQESCAVRNVLKTRHLAQILIDSKGEIQLSFFPALIEQLERTLYSFGPDRQYDALRQEHLLKVLQLLHTRKDLITFLKKFSKPVSHPWAEELIRQTLQLSPATPVTDAHTRQAVLASWLCYLRQNVGSCFATAPAEIVHDEQPELFLKDLFDLLTTGRLKRIYGGIENSVPLSASWGNGDLKKPLVLRFSSRGMTPEIWYSPGLVAAFLAAGFLTPEQTSKQRVEQLEGWIKSLFRGYDDSFYIVTAEEILRKILLQLLGITDQQVREYENRSRDMIHAQLLFNTNQNKKNLKGIGERCGHFLASFEKAKNAFKALADQALLKAWEFTLASFSESKYEFARWNLYASLGLKTNEPGGIGQCIYETIQQKIDYTNRKIQDIQYEYEAVYIQVKTLESRMRHATTEQEIQWLKMDYQNRTQEFYFLEEQRNQLQARSQALVNLYDTLYKLYVELFKDYFQEVYDADMQEVTTGPFDDSPAGFRLIYKHGRSQTSQWTRIKNHEEFVDALTSFFIATESQIAHATENKSIERDLSEVVTAIINHLKTREFLESAFRRMAIAHQSPIVEDPLNHLDKIQKKPWVYTSGGTMNTLTSCYYGIDGKPKEVEKWVENEMELLVYLADTLKQIPPSLLDPYLKQKRSALLMQSPTHAFLLKPMLSPFVQTWQNEEFTYTFIRDRFVKPAESFVERILLNEEMIEDLIQQLSEKIPENYRPRFKMLGHQIKGPLNPIFFRRHLLDSLAKERGLGYGFRVLLSADEIDGLIYASVPFFARIELKEHLHQIFDLLPGLNEEKIHSLLKLFDRIPLMKGGKNFLSARQLQQICKALLCLHGSVTSTPYDYHLEVSLAAQKLSFAMPRPLLFADTNWTKDLFGFVVNPGTGYLELWRLDYTGQAGFPMSSWKEWVNGSRPDLKWGIYVKPPEYGQN